MRTWHYCTYSLPHAYRPDVEQLRAQQLLIITISEVKVERARGEATEDEASEDVAEEEVSAIPTSTPVNTGLALVVAPIDAIDNKYFLVQFPLIAGAWSTGEYIQSLGYSPRNAYFHRAQYVVHQVTKAMRSIQRELVSRERMPADQTIQKLFDEYARGCVDGATGEQYSPLMTVVRALHYVEEVTLRKESLVGFWCALPKGAKGLLVPTHFLSACRAGIMQHADSDPDIAAQGIRLKTSPFLGPGSGVQHTSRDDTPDRLRFWRRYDLERPVQGGLDVDTSLGPSGSSGAIEPTNKYDLGASFIQLSKESCEEDVVCRKSFTRMYCPFPYPLGLAVAYMSPSQHAPWAQGNRPNG
jgi:hypothetical protein